MHRNAVLSILVLLFVGAAMVGLSPLSRVTSSQAQMPDDIGTLGCVDGWQCYMVCNGSSASGVCEETTDNTVMCKYVPSCQGCLHAIDVEIC